MCTQYLVLVVHGITLDGTYVPGIVTPRVTRSNTALHAPVGLAHAITTALAHDNVTFLASWKTRKHMFPQLVPMITVVTVKFSALVGIAPHS